MVFSNEGSAAALCGQGRVLFRIRLASAVRGVLRVVTSSSFSSKPARALPVCLVDEDKTEPSADLRTLLAGKEALYITNLDDRAVAEKEVRRGAQVALVVIPEGFGAASERPFSGEAMELELVVDPSRPMEAAMVQGIIYSAGYERLQKSFSDPKQMVDLMQRQMGGNESEPFSPTNLLIMGGMFLAGNQVFNPDDDSETAATTSDTVSGNLKNESGIAGESNDKWQPFNVVFARLEWRLKHRTMNQKLQKLEANRSASLTSAGRLCFRRG